jgi:hypothetical protein
MKHFVHYLKREIKGWSKKDNLFYADAQAPDAGFDRPMFHATRGKSGPLLNIEIGSVIWLFSTLKSPWGKLPPSLDAKFIVSGIEDTEKGKRFHAHEDSKWFPLSDATHILQRLSTIDRNGKENALWTNTNQPIGYFTQSIRQLNSGELLDGYSNKLLKSEMDFISYRIMDGTEQAFMKAADLTSTGGNVFWDRYCLPRRLSERREFVSNEKLDEYLLKKIRTASRVFGIESEKYYEQGSYASKEAALAKELNKYFEINCYSTDPSEVK